MPKINWTADVQVLGGERFTETQTIEVEAYGVTEVALAKEAEAIEVEIQPATAGQSEFMLIRASKYSDDPPNGAITYSVGAAVAEEADRHRLDGPLTLFGKGAAALLDEDPSTLFFYNSLATEVTVTFLVGRNATPDPE